MSRVKNDTIVSMEDPLTSLNSTSDLKSIRSESEHHELDRPAVLDTSELRTVDFGRDVISEFLATFFVVFFSISCVISSVSLLSDYPVGLHFTILFFHVFLLLIVIYAFAHLSGGHFNPAITITVFLARRITLIRTIFYVVAQLVGAIAGTAATLLCYPYDMRMKGGYGVINIASGTEPWNALFMEFFLTMGLVFGAFSIAFDPRGWGKLGPIGLATIVGLHFHVGAAVSFGAMNPARVFGPAVIYNSWENHWVYWVGAIPGAALGGCTYEYLFMKRGHARSTVPSTAGETSKKKKLE